VWAGGGTAVPPGCRQQGRWLMGRRNRWTGEQRAAVRQDRDGKLITSKQHLPELHSDLRKHGDALLLVCGVRIRYKSAGIYMFNICGCFVFGCTFVLYTCSVG